MRTKNAVPVKVPYRSWADFIKNNASVFCDPSNAFIVGPLFSDDLGVLDIGRFGFGWWWHFKVAHLEAA